MNKFTESQLTAISERDKNLLVSASAGTGKTTVMIERVYSLLNSGEASLNEMLIITFTKAASKDMKAKLLRKLIENENNKACRDAISQISSCDISTLDSFCQKILKTYFYVIGIDPSFKILDETEETLAKNKVFKNILTNLYLDNKHDEKLTRLISFYYKGRNETNLSDIIFKIVQNIEVRPNKEEFKETAGSIGYNLNLSENAAFKFLCEHAKTALKQCLKITEEIIGFSGDKINKRLEEDKQGIINVLSAENNIYFFNALTMLKISGETKSAEVHEDIKQQLKKRKSLFDFIKESFGGETAEKLTENLKVNQDAIKMLLKITEEFQKEYNSYKESHSVLDFSQVEDSAYKILQNKEVISELLKKYHFVFVDEYQDINELQSKIISLLGSGNTFEVGDIKQSIYGFRLTSPKIFADKFEEYKNDSVNNKLVKLNKNFRNENNGINKFVDNLFCKIMTKQTSGINYEEDGKFLTGSENWTNSVFAYILQNEKSKDEIKLVDSSVPYKITDADTDDEMTKAKREGIILAEKILENKRAGCNLSDISVISRTKGEALKQIVEVLNYYNIKTDINYSINLLKLPEVLVLHNFLKIISNFQQDIPLTGILLSPVYAFSLNDLSKIKIKYKNSKFFFETVLNYTENESDGLSDKLNKVFKDINNLYLKSQNLTVSNLVREIIAEFNYLNKFRVIKDSRIENIYSYLSVLDSFSDKTLTDYISQTEDGILEAKNTIQSSDSVKINTIHSAKGLDYKIVYLVLAGKQFNNKDAKERVIISDEFGVAISNYSEDEEESGDKKNIVLSASKIMRKKNLITEEIRLLYVALTRAKEKLVIIGTAGESANNSQITNNDDVLNAGNYLDWILGVKNDALTISTIKAENISPYTKAEKDNINILSGKENKKLTEELNNITDETPGLKSVKQKMSVSRILNLDEYFKEKEEKFSNISAVSKNEGILYHKFLEKLDVCASDLNAEKTRVITKYFNAEERNLIKDIILNNILNSGLINMLKQGELRREQKFIFKDIFEGEKVLVTGMIDALIIKPKEFIIIDYKASHKPISMLKEIYTKQLEMYSKAVSKILNIQTFSAYIYNVFSGEFLEVLHK